MAKTIPPQLGLDSFSCPHCGAIAHQDWYHLYLREYSEKEAPYVVEYSEEWEDNIRTKVEDLDVRGKLIDFVARVKKDRVTYAASSGWINVNWEFVNVNVSRCFSCKAFALWIEDRLAYPETITGITPHDDMPPQIRDDFLEAASIVDRSPRSAAALLRLCIQKLMPILEVKADSLNDAIGVLVQRGLDKRVQQALDVVRVIGNNAVHPGEIDLKDNKATATSLFELVNLIVAQMIAGPARLDSLYAGLPSTALEAIKKRDGEKS